ncbi:MAG: hypothetical protein F6J90_14380 [Moorea sp. SIOASIH]|uniref:hypothetical protein n=1 Tax=Moorena sp. SIOASIH TaxID=2607817 RepID=UPI0013BDC965|nr:hypothetical protein [Moorena sp. SIOASIH]NEO37447.1 hypothetical protein [Moorena sp. SIOASIH]
MILNQNFQVIDNAAQIDDHFCLKLGPEAKAKVYRVLINDTGQILLDPIPEEEQWLWQNPETLAAVKRGIQQTAEGKGKYLGDFAQYASMEIDD